MKIRITATGIYGANGEIPVGTELTVKEEPLGWKGRYEIVGNTEQKVAVTNPAKKPDDKPDVKDDKKA